MVALVMRDHFHGEYTVSLIINLLFSHEFILHFICCYTPMSNLQQGKRKLKKKPEWMLCLSAMFVNA